MFRFLRQAKVHSVPLAARSRHLVLIRPCVAYAVGMRRTAEVRLCYRPQPHPSRESIRRIATLLNSRSHNTELPTNAHRSQSPKPKLTVEKARCKKGI